MSNKDYSDGKQTLMEIIKAKEREKVIEHLFILIDGVWEEKEWDIRSLWKKDLKSSE